MSFLASLPVPDDCRSFYDSEKTRQWMAAGALASFKDKLNKIESSDKKLIVEDIHIPDENKRFSLKEQKKAIMDKLDLTLPIKGTYKLLDKKTGKIIDEKKTTIAHLPYVTDRNTLIFNGAEYLVSSQQRLKPGVYTRVRESGEVEAHINVKSGTGSGGKLLFFPDRALFVYMVGSTQIKLYGVLHDLGVSDDEIKKAWGEEIYLKNKQQYDGLELEKMYSKIFKYDEE